MPLTRAAKDSLRQDISDKLSRSQGAIVAEYRGLSVADITDLRLKLKEADAEFKVVKNRVAKKAIESGGAEVGPLSDSLTGPVGIVFMYGDPAAATKSVLDFEKNKKDIFNVTSGLMEGKGLSLDELKAIADLPSKDQLLAQIVGSLVSPHRGILGVLSGVPRQLVQVINAIKDTKQQ